MIPSSSIDMNNISHLIVDQQIELLKLIDKYQQCFTDRPGIYNIVEHEIKVNRDFKPKKTKAYKIPEVLKPKVDKQINEMLKLSLIRQ